MCKRLGGWRAGERPGSGQRAVPCCRPAAPTGLVFLAAGAAAAAFVVQVRVSGRMHDLGWAWGWAGGQQAKGLPSCCAAWVSLAVCLPGAGEARARGPSGRQAAQAGERQGGKAKGFGRLVPGQVGLRRGHLFY